MSLKHNQEHLTVNWVFLLVPQQLCCQQLNPVSRRHAWISIIMHFLYNPQVCPLFIFPPHPSSPLPFQELKLPVYRAHSPQIGMRRYFADLLAILSNRYQLCPTARHLAVYLLDLFMDHYDVAVKQLYVIALSCLLLASKLIFSFSLLFVKPSTYLFMFVFLFFLWEHLLEDHLFLAFLKSTS